MLTGVLHVRPSSVERLTNTVGTSRLGNNGIDEISHVLWAASKATLGSLTRSNGLAAPELNDMPGRKPGASHVAPPSPERAKPMSVAPPLKKRPTWNVATTVEPFANVSGSSSVACWLVELANGSELTRVSGTLALAVPTATSTKTTIAAA